MGCGQWTFLCDTDEYPAHEVCLEDFFLGTHEVTVAEYREFISLTGYHTDASAYGGCFRWTGIRWENDPALSWEAPGFPQTDDDPVVCVSWKDAMRYAVWKSGRESVRFRLPTEAEWEFAARNGGKEVPYSWTGENPAGNVANPSMRKAFPAWPWPFWEGYEDGYIQTAPFHAFRASSQGIYGMTGNVAEWCFDIYDAGYYASGVQDNPQGTDEGDARVVRGASWLTSPRFSRVSDRRHSRPWGRSTHLGFRLAATPEER